MMAPLYLGIDTALGGLSLCLWQDSREIQGIQQPQLNDQAAQLVPAIEALLNAARVPYSELSGIIVTVGPGGFTGVRIGLATARALGFAAGVPVMGVSTLQVMARTAPSDSATILCVLPAGRDQLYVQSFGEHALYGEPTMVSVDTVRALALNGMHLVITDQPWRAALPANTSFTMHDPTHNARLACQLANDGAAEMPEALPLYIRPPDAKPQTPLF
ncbi:MAG: tRNA (adenosine(37)-N6)-threonylcarbamoyltransferase complex dimerization subunit type 1 TsaB [Rickettsiales bacterium]|nr:tRNA (adenosine(37)-N6)-threonylcarbamoyltransferase complex dimerization subunit type 1 TsaB [Rickettsiales bacterium]